MLGTSTRRVRASRPGIRTVALAMAALMALTACSGDDGGDGNQGTSGTETGTDANGGDAGEGTEPTGGSQDDTFVVALSDTVDTIELHTFRNKSAYAITEALYGSLLDQVYEEQEGGKLLVGTTEVVGELVESFEISEDGTEATFVLKEGATFANGDPVTAEDFAYTMQRSIEGPGYIGALLPFINISSVDQIEVKDERTLVIRPSAGSPLFERFMTFHVFGALDKSRIEEKATEDDPWGMDVVAEDPIASGPYTLAQFDRERQIVLEPNPGFPGDVGNAGVTVRFIPDADQRALLLQRGELDFVSGLSPRLLQELDENPDVDVLRRPSTEIHYMGMNNEIEPLNDVKVRQAISYAMPYETLLNQVMFGFAQPAGTLVTSAMDTYAGDEIGIYETDLDKAKQLLEEAGVGDVSLELAVRQSRAADQEAAVFIQDNLSKIGVNVSISRLPDGEFLSRLNNKELPLFIHDWFSWGEDPFYQMRFLAHSGSFTNFTKFKSAELDRLIEEGTFELDPEKRAEISKQAQQILIDQAPAAYLWSADWAVAVRKDVCGVSIGFTQVPRFDRLTRC